MGNAFLNYQLQRIAEGIEGGMAGGGTLTVDLQNVADMTGATASSDGAHGLVPQPLQGEENKYLSGGGTWEDLPSTGGVDYSTSEQDTGLKWIDNKPVYQLTIVYTGALYENQWNQLLDLTPYNIEQLIDVRGINCYNNLGYSVGWRSNSVCAMLEVDGNGYLALYFSRAGYGFNKIIVTIQYTKT